MNAKRFTARLALAILSVSPLSMSTASASTPSLAIAQGASGQTVVQLQKNLNLLGFSVGVVDGIFGPLTAAQVGRFQSASHLPITHVVDAATWAAILKAVAQREGNGSTSAAGSAKTGNNAKPPGVAITAVRPTTIYLNSNLITKPYAFTANGTTYMPIWYLNKLLAALGVKSTWNGKEWALRVPATIPVDLSHVQAGSGKQSISLNGTQVMSLTGIAYPDVYTHHLTEYMPIWYLGRALSRLNVQSAWNGVRWTMTPTVAPVYTAFATNGTTVGTYNTLQAAQSAIANMPGATVRDASGHVLYTEPQPSVTVTVYTPQGTVVGTYQTITDAKAAVAAIPGGVIKDSTNKVVYTQTIPYAAFSQTGALLGVYAGLTQAESAVVNYPGAVIKDSLGQTVYTQSSTPQYGVYTATGSLVGKYAQLQQAEDALAGNPGGTVRDATGNVVFTEPDSVTYSVYGPGNVTVGSYPSMTDAESAVTSLPGATIRDTSGNVLYVQPLTGVYQAYTATGAVIGLYMVLADAEQAVSNYPGGTVEDQSGKVVYTQGGGSQGGQPPGVPSGSGFSNVDLRYSAPGNVTASAIDTYLQKKWNSPLAGLGSWFMLAQSTYGVDANYLVSHAILESTWGTSAIALAKNNIYGYGAFDSNPGVDAGRFPSLEYAILYQAWAVRHLYLNPGASLYATPTLKGMNVNYATDPNWYSSISQLMGQLASSVGDTVSSYQQFTPGSVPPAPHSTTEPVFNLFGAKAVTLPTPNYGYLPYYPDAWTTGQSQMYLRTLQSGNIGNDVATLQTALNQNFNAGLTVDGDFGPMTKAAVVAYQKSKGLPATGICDYTTWSRLVPAPVNRIAANSTVTIDAIEQGLAGGLVVAWYHVPNMGWVDSEYVHFNNMYRLTVANPKSPSDTTISIYTSSSPSASVAMTMHAGDFVVSNSPTAVGGFISVQTVNQITGQAIQGWIDASKVQLTAVQ